MSAINLTSLIFKFETTEVLFKEYDPHPTPRTPKKESPTVEAWEMMALLCELFTLVSPCEQSLLRQKTKTRNKTKHSIEDRGPPPVTFTTTPIFEASQVFVGTEIPTPSTMDIMEDLTVLHMMR